MSDLWQQLIVRNQEAGPGGPGRSNRIRNRVLAGVAAAALLFVVGSVCTYTVPQTDLAFLTQFGRVVNRDAGPIGPGIHVKLPFVQHADMLTITRDTDDLGKVDALTKDTQAVTFKVSVTTSIPPSAVYQLLYEVGRSGNVDLKRNYDATILLELRNVISRHSITEIAGEGREQVLAELQIAVQTELKRLYGVNVDQVQVSVDKMPASYVERINQAMLSQAAILQSERDRQKAAIDAETAKIRAAGEANRAIEEARGRAQSNLLEAQAQAQAIQVKGQAEADARTKMAQALTANPSLVELEKAQRWDGRLVQQNIYGSAPMPFFNLSPGTPPIR